MPETQHYPLDVTALVKGQTISIAELEAILRIRHPHPQWWNKMLRIKKHIELQRKRLRLPALTIRCKHDALHICDDSEAAVYNHAQGRQKLRGFGRAVARNVDVDISKLSTDEARDHEQHLRKQAMYLRAIRSAQHSKPPELKPPERVTPKMVGVGK